MYSLSSNPNITWKDIFENIGWKDEIFHEGSIGCYHAKISHDVNEFTYEDYLALDVWQRRTYLRYMAGCPNITWEHVALESDAYWSWHWLCSNPMNEPVKRRIQARCLAVKEELIAKALHPKRVKKWMEVYGLDWDEYV